MFLGVFGAVALLLVVRRIDGIANPQFWAEDGFVFFQDNLILGCRSAIGEFFRGFPYSGQRLIACAATPVPYVWTPLFYNTTAYVIAAACLATFSLPAFRHVVRSDALRIVFCLAVAAMPPAQELVGSMTNLSWYLGVWLLLLTVARLPDSPLGLLALAVAVVVATFSAPLAVVAAPVWLVRGLDAARRRQFGEALFSAVAVVSVVAVALITDGLGRHPVPVPSLAWPVINVVSTRVLTALVLDPLRIKGLVAGLGANAVHIVALGALAGLAALAWRAERRIAPVLLFCAYGILGSIVLQFIGRPGMANNADSIPELFRTRGWLKFSGRYQVMALAMAYLAFLALLDRLPHTRRWSAVSALLIAWLIATQIPAFVLPPFEDLEWPEHAARLERKLAERDPEPLVIPINPDRWGVFMRVGVDVRRRMIDVPNDEIVGRLVDGTTFEQTFVARCADLSEIDLWVKPTKTVGSVELVVELRDEASGRIEARFVEDSATLTYEWTGEFRSFFEAIPDSKGRRYRISLAAPGATSEDGFDVYGSTVDAYPDGEARKDGMPMPGDLAFKYGCTVVRPEIPRATSR